jgi:hypothetical protein
VTNAAPNFAPDGFPYPDCLIQAFVGGSQLHGAKVILFSPRNNFPLLGRRRYARIGRCLAQNIT